MPLRHLAAAILLVLPATAQDPSPALLAWRPLFDGTGTAGWRSFRGTAFPDRGWRVEDGALHHPAGGGGGDIVTEEEFADFELRFSWKVAPGANSGVFYRAGEEGSAVWHTGPEYQILDDAGHKDGLDPRTAAAALYGVVAGEGKPLRPPGDWNEGRIVARGPHIEHWLNGTRVLSAQVGSEAWAGAQAASKFAGQPLFASRPKGRIALQDHGDAVWFRDIWIREIREDRAIALFDGTSLAAWTWHLAEEVPPASVWTVVEEGHLVCRGEPAGYLRTARPYRDYLLTLDWRFDPVTRAAGNSGVLLRVVGPDKIWPRSVEAQLLSGSAGDFWNIADFPMHVDATRTRGRNTRRLATNENPVGAWNRYEIELDGGDLELRVNGRVLNLAREVAHWPGAIALQSEGAVIHFRDVRLWPIEAAEAGRRPPWPPPPAPRWRSGRLEGGATREFDLEIAGARGLWLVVDPLEDGNGRDWADWGELELVQADGRAMQLADRPFTQATSGYGEVRAGANCTGGPLRLGGRLLRNGIGTHAGSLIHWDLEGLAAARLRGVVGIDEGGLALGPGSSVEFLVYIEDPGPCAHMR
jgi:hypothetical protein